MTSAVAVRTQAVSPAEIWGNKLETPFASLSQRNSVTGFGLVKRRKQSNRNQ